MNQTKYRILVCGESLHWRENLIVAFKNFDYGEVIGDEDSAHLITAASLFYPDVVLWKPNQARIDEVISALLERCPSTLPIIILDNPNEYDILDLLRVGIRGCLPARLFPSQIVSAVNLIVTGGLTCLPRLSWEMPGEITGLNQEVYRHLTLREIEILSLVGRQASNQEIADELFLSLSTVKTHLRNIFRKLEVKSRSEAIKIMQNNCGQVSCNLPEKRIKTN